MSKDDLQTVEAYTAPKHGWDIEDVITSYTYVKHWWRLTSWHEVVTEKLEVRFLCSFHHTRYYLVGDGRIAIHNFLAPLDDDQGRTMCTKPKHSMSYFISGFMIVPDDRLPLEVVTTADIRRLSR